MEELAEPSTSSWLVAHGNMHGDGLKTRPLYWGMIQAHQLFHRNPMLIISQFATPINALPSGSIRFRLASFLSKRLLLSSQRAQAVPPHRHAIQPFPTKILSFFGLLFSEPRRRDHRRIS